MMDSFYSLFATATGELTGLSMEGAEQQLNSNAPEGHAWVAGRLDPRLWTVQCPIGDDGPLQPVAVPRAPVRPGDTDYQTWDWSAGACDWVPTYTLKWHQRVAMEPLLQQLRDLDAPLARPLSDLMLALAAGTQAPAVALAKVTAVEDEKAPVRSRIAAIQATNSIEQLEALIGTPLQP